MILPDNLYRLTSETISGDLAGKNGVVGYTYDAVGNRKERTSTLEAVPASGLLYYDANDRTSTDTYDDNGNTVSQAGIGNQYDFENRLIKHGAMTFTYDGDGNRVAKTVGGVTTQFLVDTANPTGYAQAVDELTNGSVSRTYAYGLDLISQSQTIDSAWSTSWYAYDGHGSVRVLTDDSGSVTDTYTYDAFGSLINQTGSTPNNYLFAGEQYDWDLGLYYNRARYLDVRAGRFWGMDNLEGSPYDPQTLHKYLYGRADAVNRVDKSGNMDISLGNLMTAFSVQAVLFRMAVGATLGAIDSALAGASVANGALQGAVIGALGPLIPGKVLFLLGVYGIFDALRNEQYAAAGFRIALLGFGTFAQTKGFKSFGKFKEVFGKAGEGKAWHHIVEQSQESTFGAEKIQNPQNIASVREGAGLTHRKITGFYNSKQPEITGAKDLTIREWLSTKSFEEQYAFGLETMERFGGGSQIDFFGLTNSWAWPTALRPFEESAGDDGDD